MTNECSCTAIKSSTGLGKSTVMRKQASDLISNLRAKSDTRSVVVFVPTIKLAQEQMHKFSQEYPALTAECFIGSNNDNPDKTNVTMCERTEAMTLVDKGIALSNLCGTEKSNEWCEHHIKSGCENPCGYSRQSHIHADIWFMAHQKLFTPKPSNINPIAIVIDESFWEASISTKFELQLSDLSTVYISSEYEKSCEIISPYLTKAHDGYLDVGHIRSTSSRALGGCYKAIDELKSYRSNKITSSMMPNEVNQALDGLPSKSVINFWRILANALRSCATKTPYIKKATNNKGCLFHLNERQNIHNDWNVDTLLLDATLSTGITKTYFHNVKTHVIECTLRYTTVTQISDMPLSKKMILPVEMRGKKKNAELIKNMDKLVSILNVRLATITTGVNIEGHSDLIKILLVTNKAIEKNLKEHDDFPKGIATMHFGATSGIDIYKNVPSLVIAGRQMLTVKDSERLGSYLKGEVLTESNSEDWYAKRNLPIVTKSTVAYVESDYHDNPIIEAVRFSKTEAELIQAIGRVRGVRRNVDNPVDILILTNVPIPLKVDLLTTWNEVVPTKFEALLAEKKIVPLSYSELTRVYPLQFISKKVARTDVNNFFKRYTTIQDVVKSNLSALLPIYNTNREKGTQFQHYKELRLVRYTRNTKGAKPCFAMVFDIKANEIEEALSLVVGQLKSYQYICGFSEAEDTLP